MKRLIAAALTATTMALAACTATAGTDPTTAPSTSKAVVAPTSTGPTTTDPIESWLSGAETTATTPTSIPPTGSSTGSNSATDTDDPTAATGTAVTGDTYDAIPVTIPDTVTGAELKAANAAIPVWRNAMRLYDQSMQDPSADWTAKLRKYVVDPAAITQLSLVAALAKDGMHQVGEIGYTAEVVAAKEHSVQIRACVDVSGSDVVAPDGVSIVKPGGVRRFYRDFNLDYYLDAGLGWRLNFVTTPQPVEPC